METATRKPLADAGNAIVSWLSANRALFKTNLDFAAACGFSEPTLSKIINARRDATPDQALAMHRVSQGGIPANIIRPDLWASPESVPSQEPEPSAPAVTPAEAARC